MKKIIYVLLVAVSFGFVSCDNWINGYPRTRAKVDKLLANREFEKARELVNKKVSARIDRQGMLKNISRTQITILFEDGEYETASALARELKMEDVLSDAFFKNIRQIIKRNRYDFVFETLMDWQCPAEAKTYKEDLAKNFDYLLEEREPTKDYNGKYYPCLGGQYNWCVRPVNNTIDIVLQKVMFEGNPNNIRRCLMCYKPYSVFDKKVKTNEFCGREKTEEMRYYKFFFKMQNTAKEDAEKMLHEAKIEY